MLFLRLNYAIHHQKSSVHSRHNSTGSVLCGLPAFVTFDRSDRSMITFDTWVLIVATIVVLISAWLWQRDKKNKFDLLDLISGDDGKLSLSKTGQLVALLVSTWGFVALTRADKMSEWFFTGYMLAWAGANIASKALDIKKGQP